MNITQQILSGKTSIGIEFGSTRIKAVMVGEELTPIASGTYDWENRLENGLWTYSDEDIRSGLRGCFASLAENVRSLYGTELKTTGSIGISAMMHGYLAFDKSDRLLVPFRTWRNTVTKEAADILTEKLNFNIPQRWSVAHLYQAILNKEPHISEIRFLTTLAGYVHFLLTGRKVIGIGDASGMFPIENGGYNADMLDKFASLTDKTEFCGRLEDILPEIIPVGECAGRLTEEGALLLDPTGVFGGGISFCPPEGDAQTGMVATDSIAVKTGNVSAGTSIFAMAVLENNLKAVHREIDIVTTPCGSPVAMVHCNNCTGDIDGWIKLFDGMLKKFGLDIPKNKLYDTLYEAALSGKGDCGGIVGCNYFSGEHVTGLSEGIPMLMRTPDADFSIENLMRSLVYSCMATLKIGMDILTGEENVRLEKLNAHGGLFKSPAASQRFLAAALNVPVAIKSSAGEGGAWGIALLAAFAAREEKSEGLEAYLKKRVFAELSESCVVPDKNDIIGFAEYTEKYKALLKVEKYAVTVKEATQK